MGGFLWESPWVGGSLCPWGVPWGSPGVPEWVPTPHPPPEVQLKPRHRPLRLVRHWPELLLRFSLGSPAAIAQGEAWGVGGVPLGVPQPR